MAAILQYRILHEQPAQGHVKGMTVFLVSLRSIQLSYIPGTTVVSSHAPLLLPLLSVMLGAWRIVALVKKGRIRSEARSNGCLVGPATRRVGVLSGSTAVEAWRGIRVLTRSRAANRTVGKRFFRITGLHTAPALHKKP